VLPEGAAESQYTGRGLRPNAGQWTVDGGNAVLLPRREEEICGERGGVRASPSDGEQQPLHETSRTPHQLRRRTKKQKHVVWHAVFPGNIMSCNVEVDDGALESQTVVCDAL